MSDKWTPGPWEISSNFTGPLVISPAGKRDDAIAYVFGETFPQVQADARLISAAPDMAEALAELLKDVDKLGKLDSRGHGDEEVWIGDASGVVRVGSLRRARSALAKARGET